MGYPLARGVWRRDHQSRVAGEWCGRPFLFDRV